MKKINLEKYKRGIITIEIQTNEVEKFINLLWENGIIVRNINKKNIVVISFDVALKDYNKIRYIAKETHTKIRIINRKGVAFFVIKNRNRKTLLVGIIIFIAIIYYLSTFVWNINITTESNVTPYEIRSQLKTLGITPGINKRKINVYDIEDKIIKDNKDIMWARARMEGVKLNIDIAERHEPPEVIVDNSPCSIVAKQDGEIVRVYSTAGTAVVKEGDIVKKGDVLVKGEQGKEEETYFVHAMGKVIARTFYERKKEVPINDILKERTGNSVRDVYIKIGGKKIYLKKAKNKFKTYDKIYIDKPLVKQQVYYEIKEKKYKKDKEQIVKKTSDELFSNVIVNLDKSVKIVDKVVDYNIKGDKIEVRAVLIAEEDIGCAQNIELNLNDEKKLDK